MKKTILLISILIFGITGYAQLNNSWIDYSKTYYKFYVGENKLHRITKAALTAAGIGETNADHFQLWRNGKEVSLLTTQSGGALAANGYIEFVGEPNDFEPDRKLYNPGVVLISEKYSLFTDTAAYFLTINASGGNLRFRNVSNTAPSALAPTPYFMRDFVYHNKAILSNGRGEYLGQYIYSSAFDEGEGWMTESFLPNTDYTYNLPIYPYKDGPQNNVEITYTVEGFSYFSRLFQLKVNGGNVDTAFVSGVRARKKELKNLPVSLLTSPTTFTLNASGDRNDRTGYGYFQIRYPSVFYFNNSKVFSFSLPQNPTEQNIEITGFNYGSLKPVLYDLTNRVRIEGEIASSPGTVKFVLPSLPATSNFVLINQVAVEVNTISSLTKRTFVDFGKDENQGDYLMITDPKLNLDNKAVNVSEEYKTFRKSADGGSFNPVIYDINELTDQFGLGIKMHPSGVQDFIFFADRNFKIKPKFVLLIGRGLEYNYRYTNRNSPEIMQQDFVPTFGMPASDILLATLPGKSMPIVPIGRIASVNGQETRNYLDKLKQYVAHQRFSSPKIDDKLWMKNFMHVIGGATAGENDLFSNMGRQYEAIARDTFIGAHVETFTKTSSGAVQQANNARISQLFKEGLTFMQYFGHATATVLEYNLTDLSIYEFNGKYPIVNISGCDAGNNFRFYSQRATAFSSISENYVLTPDKGSVGFLASTHFGIPSFLHAYNLQLYNQFGRENYGGYLGHHIQKAIEKLGGNEFGSEFRKKLQNEQTNLHGDPAIKINYADKPDYAIEDKYVVLNPSTVSVADNKFDLKIKFFNLGKAINDSILITVKRKTPNQQVTTLFSKRVKATLYSDSIMLNVPVSLTEKGTNELTITLDDGNKVDELYESNNVVSKSFIITETAVRPIYPYNYAIVNYLPDTLYASSTKFSVNQEKYLLEIDTSVVFSSPGKRRFEIMSRGGLLEFPVSNYSISQNRVYYWRVSNIVTGQTDTAWEKSSFIYLSGGGVGFNQSHIGQFVDNSYDSLSWGENRILNFSDFNASINFSVGYNYGSVSFGGLLDFARGGRFRNSIEMVAIDNRGQPISNDYTSGSGLYGSVYMTPTDYPNQFEYSLETPAGRKLIADFIDRMPNDATILVFPYFSSTITGVNEWKNDAAIYGAGNTLYDKLKLYGFTSLDSLTEPRPFIFIFRKDGSITPYSQIGRLDEILKGNKDVTFKHISGKIVTSPLGPAKKWQSFNWEGRRLENVAGDEVSFRIIGVDRNFLETELMRIDSTNHNVDISNIDAATYPYLKIEFTTSDPISGTPYQPNFWRLYYAPLPEGAIKILPGHNVQDSLVGGDSMKVHLAFKNVSKTAFEKPIKINFSITGNDNVTHPVIMPDGKALLPGDTIMVSQTIDQTRFGGSNLIYLEFNPANDQPEQFHFNNIFINSNYIQTDVLNPLLDVSFDGVHILNKDIVSANPQILISLTDENKTIALRDTALFRVQLLYPNGELKTLRYGTDLQFNPADLSGGINKATIQFNPILSSDGEYELMVSARDEAGNTAGKVVYRISFTVMNKPMISNLLNYPNPFTTSTAFVFTLTGAEVPQNLRIQIMTITGKIVREITRAELGPIHIGRNITDFKWDGTDSYGQKLGNGIYLYRVITNLNNKALEKYTPANDTSDQYFNKGYGKMYLMR